MKKYVIPTISLMLAVSSQAAVVTLDPENQWGAANTVISLSGGAGTSANRGQFTATDVGGSGVDIRFTVTGDVIRTGFPRTFTGNVIQGSAEFGATATDSSIDTVTAAPAAQQWASRGYTLEFFATTTTDLVTVSNFTMIIGDVDELERYGLFSATSGGANIVYTVSPSAAATHVSVVDNGTDSVFIESDATAVTNGTTDGNVLVNFSGNLDTFSFIAEKGQEVNLGVIMDTISFDPEPIPEPSSALLLGMSSVGFLLRRKR